MPGIALLVFREVLEAALIVTVVCAATRGVPRRGLFVGGGLILGVLGALLVALFADALANAFSGVGQEVFNAGVLLAAVLMISWHVLWMSGHGRAMAAEMKALGGAVQSGSSSLMMLLLVVALAVLREGSEVVLFLYGMVAGGAVGVIGGLALGVIAGSAVGFALYYGLLRIPLRHFFSATNAMLMLLAAGLASSAARYLVQANLLPALADPLWDSSWLLSNGSLPGQTLHILVGYDARPSGIMLVFYTVTLLTLFGGMRWVARAAAPRAGPAAAAIAVQPQP
ncbi:MULTISPECIES: FTR1 family protein [unclassified Rhodanobacter]|uniref:FTR1 family iron permease n=1 Tax=unclassified Rhodanobacter TaxID=2621553 RepID=UPI001BE0BBC7|nr:MULTISPECIES: FTR1 family protein [unclassified Rhodanobacter]MBT2144734.1 FTR1 family protein [Rhodanobacter sp. LX-99]MBT2148779.1 FTR1 family protein [Rhodanobacter sp. LX-100]